VRIRLREIQESDLAFLNQCRNKPSVSRQLNLFQPQSLERERQWLLTPKNEIHFLIVAGKTEAIGQVSLIHFSHKDKKAEFTIFLDDTFWGRGYGKTATRLMLHYAFTELNLHKIYLHVYEGNERARNMYKSIGFIEEGKLRDFIFKDGNYISAHIYGILSHEFFTHPNTDGIVEPLLYDDGTL